MGSCSTKGHSRHGQSKKLPSDSRRTTFCLTQLDQTVADVDKNQLAKARRLIIAADTPEISATETVKVLVADVPYRSCFLHEDFLNDPIGKIVRLESACIRLKAQIEREKVNLKSTQKQAQSNSFFSEDKYLSEAVENPQNGVSTRNTLSPTGSRKNHDNLYNEIACFDTLIQLADFVQEKSNLLWNDPHDADILDAISSIFWAADILNLSSLIEFKEHVSSFIQMNAQVN